jgi:cytochrome c-type biogenesis protein CcmH
MASAILLGTIFGILALVAAGFACLPLVWGAAYGLRVRFLLFVAGIAGIFVVGGGLYVARGTPSLALRSLEPPSTAGFPGLVAALAARARDKSFKPAGWVWLGRGYLTLGDANDAAAAFRRAIQTAPPRDRPALLSAYGEALTMAASGAVTPEAETAFRSALAADPKDVAARYFLGLDYAARGDRATALGYWKSLLADAPADAPWRGQLLDRIAALKSQSGEVPDVFAMVAGLAARLKANPDDPEGWGRLMRAYAVLGERDKAVAALAEARTALSGNAQALGALRSEAVSLKLE